MPKNPAPTNTTADKKGEGGKPKFKTTNMQQKRNPMDKRAASRIQSSAAKQGGGVEKGSFAARAQSAAAKNANTRGGGT